MQMPDYTNSITNLSNSILKHFGVKTFHNSIPEIDELIANSKKIVVFLFDGMGEALIEKHLEEDSYIRSHIVHRMTSTFPPTTVAATTSFRTGKYPIETSWIGWTQYIKSLDANIDVFPNVYSDSHKQAGEHSVMESLSPVKTICELINEQKQNTIAHEIFPKKIRHDKGPILMSNLFKSAYKLAHQSEESFVYAYWTKPDALIHKYGVNSRHVKNYINKINRAVVRYSTMPKNKDVVTIIIADHGLIDVKPLNMELDHPDLFKMLKRRLSLEKRGASFFIKDEYMTEFPELFKKYYGEHYALYTKEQVLEMNLFGDAKPSPLSLDFIGDYVGVALDEYILIDNSHPFKMIGHHGGSTEEEYVIDIFLTLEQPVDLSTKWVKPKEKPAEETNSTEEKGTE